MKQPDQIVRAGDAELHLYRIDTALQDSPADRMIVKYFPAEQKEGFAIYLVGRERRVAQIQELLLTDTWTQAETHLDIPQEAQTRQLALYDLLSDRSFK
jgi:hypothetical protein